MYTHSAVSTRNIRTRMNEHAKKQKAARRRTCQMTRFMINFSASCLPETCVFTSHSTRYTTLREKQKTKNRFTRLRSSDRLKFKTSPERFRKK